MLGINHGCLLVYASPVPQDIPPKTLFLNENHSEEKTENYQIHYLVVTYMDIR